MNESRSEETGVQRRAIACLVVVAVAVVILRSMGRSWWCSCGSPVPWSWDIWSSHNSQHLIDPYFFSHLLHGVLIFGCLALVRDRLPARAGLLIAITLEAGWEILENSPLIIERYRAATISLDYYGDSIANSLSDILACVLGYVIASRLRWWWTVAFLLAIELGLLITIRDCLTINVIMLVHPIEAIREWQVR